MPARLVMDQGHVELTAEVRDREFQPAADARVTANITGPGGLSESIDLTPSQETPGLYHRRLDRGEAWVPISPKLRPSPRKTNRWAAMLWPLSAKTAWPRTSIRSRTGICWSSFRPRPAGSYWKRSDVKNLPRDISYSEAGISVRNTKELWNMPIVFLLLLGLPIAEWLLRRKWGVL